MNNYKEMKRSIIYFSVLILILLVAQSCRTSKRSSYQVKNDTEVKANSSEIILDPPVNAADKTELSRFVYSDQSYHILQKGNIKFKDNSPFIEYIDGGKHERLWFASSRADSVFFGHKRTNSYQQIYYCDRTIEDGKSPKEGWGDVKMLIVESDNPFYNEFIKKFNISTKGAVAIAGNIMLFSCDVINENGISEFKDIWELKREGEKFKNPKPVAELSGQKTWESQPSLSADGKHLFFVSNRKIDKDGITINTEEACEKLSIFYSYNENGKWKTPVLVSELYSEGNEITPHICYSGNKLYFSSDKEGSFKIYEADLSLNNENGGYTIDKSSVKLFSSRTISFSSKNAIDVSVNTEFNQNYPFIYFNPLNVQSPRAIYWSSDIPSGYGSYDIYACPMPFVVDMNVVLTDIYNVSKPEQVLYPVIKIEGDINEKKDAGEASFKLYSGLDYKIYGGSYANSDKGLYDCDENENFIFTGYSKIVNDKPGNTSVHSRIINGPEVQSILTDVFGSIPLKKIFSDTIINDTVFVTKGWLKKPPCPGKLNIEPTHRSIAYFQTGFWEVNTTENLKRDLTDLHEGFEVSPDKDIYNPGGKINRKRSDYKAFSWETPLFPIKPGDGYTYSIADAQWIELHPNNLYWGDRPGYEGSLLSRMKGRKERINQYLDYAKKVDENLKNLTDTIKLKYINLLDLHKDLKPKLLIEIFAVSDQREVLRGWYIGDVIQYRGSDYLEGKNIFDTEMVKIVPPDVDEKTKTLTRIKACTVDFNAEGDNGSMLGIQQEKTDQNTNLSRLRAWFGYKEVLKRLTDSEKFNRYLKEGKVALPDNDVKYEDADIIVITRGKREDGDVKNPKYPYPDANNPSGNGYFDYDKIRRIEIQTRLILTQEGKTEDNYCCDPDEKAR